jgi:hypothetical protein
MRGLAHVLFRRPSPNRRRGPPTHTFVLPPQHARCRREAAWGGTLPTDEYLRLSPVPATPIALTSGDLPARDTQGAFAKTSKPNLWGTTSSPTPRGMNDEQTSSVYR